MSVFEKYAHYYDRFYADKNYDGECSFIEAGFARFGQRTKSILDLACGTGNHGIRLAARGYQLCGMDRSSEMLSQYRRKLDTQRLSVELHQQDLRHLDLGRQFDAAI